MPGGTRDGGTRCCAWPTRVLGVLGRTALEALFGMATLLCLAKPRCYSAWPLCCAWPSRAAIRHGHSAVLGQAALLFGMATLLYEAVAGDKRFSDMLAQSKSRTQVS